jgi:peptidoglycan/LPS O-acetylase OafA/YrhL
MIKRFLGALKKLYLSITAEVEIENKLDFLSGLRGILALNVVLAHHFYAIKAGDSELISVIRSLAGPFAVIGFFVLSSFLLTYRLLIDFKKSAKFEQTIGIIIQYFTRRILRIYVPFFVFCACVELGPGFLQAWDTYPSFFDLVSLKLLCKN